jgi:membrane dipeptidase
MGWTGRRGAEVMETSTLTGVIDTDRADQLHARSIVIDTRDPTYLVHRQMGGEKPEYWDALQSGGITAVLVDVPWVEDAMRDALVNFADWLIRIDRSDERAVLVRGAADIVAAKAAGRLGIVFGSQTPTIIDGDVRFLRVFHEMGLRVLQMAYQRRNPLADGCGESADGGVSDLGREAIEEMNRLGIAIDLSHASDRTMLETIAHSSMPVFFSHSNRRSVVNHRRNVPDETLKRLAARGGVCCVSAYSDFLADRGSATGTTVDQFAEMARHMVDLIGIDHVGFGLDSGESRTEPEIDYIGSVIGGGTDISKRYALTSRRQLPGFTRSLLKVGFREAEVEKILGGNVLRFFGEVWRG